MKKKIAIALFFSLLILQSGQAFAQNSVSAASVSVDPPTINSIGLVWNISGDDNGSAKVDVEYRKVGQTSWKDALPFLRVQNSAIGAINPGNILAGSIFNLDPATTYQFRLSLNDPDGGGETRIVEATTRAIPATTNLTDVKYVEPGSGGGSGTGANPYRGLAAANANAQPGDVFFLKAGTYNAISLSKDGLENSPITYHGENRNNVIISGELGLSSRRYIVLENITFRSSGNAIEGSNTVGIVIRENKIERTAANSATAIRLAGNSQNSYICDNTITGKNEEWRPGTWEEFRNRAAGGFGIKLSGSGHIVCHNYIYGFWDAIGMANGDSRNAGISFDIHNNDISYCIDDGIETDYSQRNIRVYKNRIANTLKGVTAQPVYGGPIYFIRNEMYAIDSSPYKYHESSGRKPSGMIALHNSTASARQSFKGGNWVNSFFRNNLFYSRDNYYSINTTGNNFYNENNSWGTTLLDFNGYAKKYSPMFAFSGSTYSGVNDFCSGKGYECNGLEITRQGEWGDLTKFPEPQGFAATSPAVGGRDWDYSLVSGAQSIDSAVRLANINDDYSGTAPDRGALERGKPLPVYGPRTGGVDADGDGYEQGNDCNDNDAAINPGAVEICDSVDNDCDSQIDEGGVCNPIDNDGDGYDQANDCNDDNAAINPGAAERCDGVDNNCNGQTDEGYNLAASCSAGVGLCQQQGTFVCQADGSSACSASPLSPPETIETSCEDGQDNDCDSFSDTYDSDCPQPAECLDNDGDGFGPSCLAGADCNDFAANINPLAPETCDNIDNNCNAQIDEDNVCTPGNEILPQLGSTESTKPTVSGGCMLNTKANYSLLIILLISFSLLLSRYSLLPALFRKMAYRKHS